MVVVQIKHLQTFNLLKVMETQKNIKIRLMLKIMLITQYANREEKT